MQIFSEACEKRALECGCSAYRGRGLRGDGGHGAESPFEWWSKRVPASRV